MVAYINIQMTEYLATNYSLFDLAIVTIVIVSILILGLVYFSGSKKKTECTASLSVEEEKSDSDLVLSPRITIVFQKDLSDDEELSRERICIFQTGHTIMLVRYHRSSFKYFRKNQMMFLSNMKVLIFPL